MTDKLVERLRNAASYSREYGPITNAPLLEEAATALENLAGGANSLSTEVSAQLKADSERFAAWFGQDDDLQYRAILFHHDHMDPGEPDTLDSWREAIDAALREGNATEGK